MAVSGSPTVLPQDKQLGVSNRQLLTIPDSQPNPPIIVILVFNMLHAYKRIRKSNKETEAVHQ